MKLATPSSDLQYDLAVVGSSFASSFFLYEYLKHAPANARVVVLERGALWSHDRQISERSNSPFDTDSQYTAVGAHSKAWNFSIGFGGGSNCWWGNTPRLMPADFEMRSRFGQAEDWPFGYDALEPYYEEAEAIMSIAGPRDGSPYPKSGPYPSPPHLQTRPEELLRALDPTKFFEMPTARASTPLDSRAACCGNGVCHLCPMDAKFTILNGLAAPYADPRVTVALGAEVDSVIVEGGAATGVAFRRGAQELSVRADFVALGANAIFNPAILLKSGLKHPLIGKRIHEQIGLRGEVLMDGVPSFQGSTSVTGLAYHLYDDEARRRDLAACLIETWNVGLYRADPGKLTHVLPIRMVFDDLPRDENRVIAAPGETGAPRVHFDGHSDYALRALARAQEDAEKVFSGLPIEGVRMRRAPEPTEAHIMGTAPMGKTAEDSVVDHSCLLHEHRNVAVLGGSAFPTGSPANPSLTIAALSLRAGHAIFSGGATG